MKNQKQKSFLPIIVGDFETEVIRADIELAFYHLEDYFKEIEKQINTLKIRNKGRIQSYLKAIKDIDQYQEESSFSYQEHYEIYEDLFPRMFTYSFITMIYIAVESSFNKLSKYLKKQGKCKLDLDAFSGSLAERVKNLCKAFSLSHLTSKDIMI